MQIFKVFYVVYSQKSNKFAHMTNAKKINDGLGFDSKKINSINIADASNAEWEMVMNYIKFNTFIMARNFGVSRNSRIEDAPNDCILKVWSSKDSFDPAKGVLTTWLKKAIFNVLIDFIHEQRKTQGTEDLEEIKEYHEKYPRYDPDSYDSNEAINLLYKFASKQTGDKRVLTLMVLNDFDNHEIAERLGVKPSVVEIRKFRLKTEMKGFLKLYGFDYLPLTA